MIILRVEKQLQSYSANPVAHMLAKPKMNEQLGNQSKLMSCLNRTSDQDTQANSNIDQIQYMKRYYDFENSITKLARLIQYYEYDEKSKRFLNLQARSFLSKNRIDEIKQFNPEDSDKSMNFNFYMGNILSQSVFYSGKASSSNSLINGFLNNLKNSHGNKFNKTQSTSLVQLNYIPYRSKKRVSKQGQLKFEKELESLEKKWLNSSKYLKRLIN